MSPDVQCICTSRIDIRDPPTTGGSVSIHPKPPLDAKNSVHTHWPEITIYEMSRSTQSWAYRTVNEDTPSRRGSAEGAQPESWTAYGWSPTDSSSQRQHQ